jgi:nucleotide-binding universal stress UspA family protein
MSAGGKKASKALARAESYLTAHEVEATYERASGPASQAILQTAAACGANMIIMGGFGQRSALQLVLGSTVTKVLRATTQPVFVCR